VIDDHMILLELYESIHAPVWPVLPVRIRGFRTKIELATFFIGRPVKKLYSFFTTFLESYSVLILEKL